MSNHKLPEPPELKTYLDPAVKAAPAKFAAEVKSIQQRLAKLRDRKFDPVQAARDAVSAGRDVAAGDVLDLRAAELSALNSLLDAASKQQRKAEHKLVLEKIRAAAPARLHGLEDLRKIRRLRDAAKTPEEKEELEMYEGKYKAAFRGRFNVNLGSAPAVNLGAPMNYVGSDLPRPEIQPPPTVAQKVKQGAGTVFHALVGSITG